MIGILVAIVIVVFLLLAIVAGKAEMTDSKCEHPEFIGHPYGYVPTSWECTKCMLHFPAGEFEIYARLARLEFQIVFLRAKVQP